MLCSSVLCLVGGNTACNGGGTSNGGGGFDTEGTDEYGRCSPLLQQMPSKYLLPIPHFHDGHKKCMVIDLDETLVHSSFKVISKQNISSADFMRYICAPC